MLYLMYMKVSIVLLLLVFLGVGCSSSETPMIERISSMTHISEKEHVVEQKSTQSVTFTDYSDIYQFTADIPAGFEVAYVPEIESINIYNPKAEGDTPLEQSQIFIRYFTAHTFLTLSTVTIHSKEETQVHGHDAVAYDIEKKAGIANFAYQPEWRSKRHQLTDVRYSVNNPSTFFVFAYNPDFGAEAFQAFLERVQFHNDASSFVAPIDRAQERITKKPFRLYVTTQDSPVSPERFSGYHTGTDFEAFEHEQGVDVPVYAICGGELLQAHTASGYGGVAVQACEYEGQPVRVVYGHIDIGSITKEVRSYIAPGEQFAVLGEQGVATDKERKHLHLGIRKGTRVNLAGYVQNERDLGEWMDYEELVK